MELKEIIEPKEGGDSGRREVLNRQAAGIDEYDFPVLDMMEKSFPEVQVDRDCHVIIDETVFTSAGVSAGIDLALQMVRLDFGEAQADWTARHIEYAFDSDNFQRRLKINLS